VAPSKSTIWRVPTDADPDAFDTVVGIWLTNRAPTTPRALSGQC
jgi:hypothetical protein